MLSPASPLPIHAHRDEILAALRSSPVLIVLGDTGCGKTTQLPQILAEQGYAPICITQPRRVAAIAAARRVAEERGAQVGGDVGFAVRFEHSCTDATQIKFVTDGVLLREAVSSPQLPGIDALILDEAHERSLNTDVLFATIKRLLVARRSGHFCRKRKGGSSSSSSSSASTSGEGSSGSGVAAAAASEGGGDGEPPPLGPRRVIIASATLDPAKLSAYFFDAPVLRVPGRCFPVQIFHTSKPSGGSAQLLETAIELALRLHVEGCEAEGAEGGGAAGAGGDVLQGDMLVFLTGQEEIETAAAALRTLAEELQAERPGLSRLEVLPLHATLPAEQPG